MNTPFNPTGSPPLDEEGRDFTPLPLDSQASDDLTVTDLKQYTHCARFAYHENVLPEVRPRTYKMEAGEEAHVRERERARRRTLAQYGLPEGERHFNLRIHCPDLGLRGELDELVIAPSGVYLPVDYKLSTKVSDSFRVQIAAYALLVESRFKAEGARVETGYLYLIVPRSLHPVPITEALRTQVRASLTAIRDILRREQLPPPPRARAKCRDCEFRRFCNDV